MRKTLRLACLLAAFTFSCGRLSADDEIPYGEGPTTNTLPSGAVLRFAIPPPPFVPASDPPASPATATNFQAIADDLSPAGIPPDTQGAVGPTNVMTMLNTYVVIQDREGRTNAATTISNWWGFASTKPFDPRIVYDPYSGRWIAVAGGNQKLSDASVLVAVSQTSDPTGSWYRRKLDADTNQTRWADFPMIGFTKDRIVVTANMYVVGSSARADFNFVRLWVFNKTNLYAGGTNAPTILMAETNAPKAFTLAPSLVFDDAATNMYLLTAWNTNALRVYSLTGPLGSEQLSGTTNFPAVATNKAWVQTYSDSLNFLFQALTNGSYTKVFANDDRISSPVIQRNGFLWCVHHIFLPYGPAADLERTAVQWWQISLQNFIVQPIGRIDKLVDDTSYAFPSIAVNRFNDVLIGYSRFSSIQWISGNYSLHDSCDTVGTLRGDVVLKAGQANYLRSDTNLRNRWGDYSATAVDPVNDTDLWTLQEYAGPGSRWGMWWGKIALPVPANDSFANAFAITNSTGSTNGTVIRATMETGEPLHGSGTNTPSVWFRWVAPASSDVTFSLAGGSSSFPFVIALYTGTTVNGLTLKTNASGAAPIAVFTATSGTTYQIAVAGLNVACAPFTLTWAQASAPMFVQHPEGTNVVVGESAVFNSLAIANPNPTYFWKFRGTNSSDITNGIAGANSATYTLTNVIGTNAGSYWAVASNVNGFATSSVATLFVHGNSAARLVLPGYSSTSFFFHIYGLTNRAYRVEASTNLGNPASWVTLYTNNVSYWYTNYSLTNPSYRFFRAITNE